jgi:hypothetical protein
MVRAVALVAQDRMRLCVKAVCRPGEDQSAFIREAVNRELARREAKKPRRRK